MSVTVAAVADIDVFDRLEAALRATAPKADPAIWVPALKPALIRAGCTTPQRIAALLGQCRAEAGPAFEALVENLNYSAQALLTTWPKRFSSEVAAEYARQPERIANFVYADRRDLGNGPKSSGDGWTFRGRGLIQITGRNNFKAFEAWWGQTIPDPARWVPTPAEAAMTAAWFWEVNNLNQHAQTWDIDAITQAVNGKGAPDTTKEARLTFSNDALVGLNPVFA